MQKIKVGLNGFGRIGRAIYRHNLKNDLFDISVINDINPDIHNLAYLLQYDTTYGKLDTKVVVNNKNNSLHADRQDSKIYHKQNIFEVPWDKHQIDIVIDCSGIKSNFISIKNKHKNYKIKNFIITNAPSGENIKTIIFGVNENELNPLKHKIISSSICDTISLAPIIKIITNTHKIESGFLTTLHPWLSYQNLIDGPSVSWSQPGDIYSHYALGRSSVQNIIPKSTSAVSAADNVFENLSEKIQSFSFRIPTSIVSNAILTLMLDKEIDKKDLLKKFHNFEKEQSIKIIRNSSEPLTSTDYIGENYSAIIDHRWTKINNKKHIQLMYWYDNEWGYSARVIDLIIKLSNFYNK